MTSSQVGTFSPWASGARSSHVGIRLPSFNSLTPVAELPQTPHDFVLAGFGHVVVVHRGGFSVFDAQTHALRAHSDGTLSSSGFPLLSAQGVFSAYAEFGFDGVRTERAPFDPFRPTGGRVWAASLTDTHFAVLAQRPLSGNHDSVLPPSLTAVAEKVPKAGRYIGEFLAAQQLKNTEGVGAISANGDFVVATRDRQLLVFPLPANRQGPSELSASVRKPLPFTPYDIALIGGKVTLIQALGSDAANAFSEQEELAVTDAANHARWTTSLHWLELSGTETAHVAVPFPVLQPPVDLDQGRVLLVGLGFAAVEGNRVVFTHRSERRCLATASAGGTFALACGAELQIVTRDGAIRETFKVRDGESITTPPAIGEDGSVWLATQRALYVAR